MKDSAVKELQNVLNELQAKSTKCVDQVRSLLH